MSEFSFNSDELNRLDGIQTQAFTQIPIEESIGSTQETESVSDLHESEIEESSQETAEEEPSVEMERQHTNDEFMEDCKKILTIFEKRL